MPEGRLYGLVGSVDQFCHVVPFRCCHHGRMYGQGDVAPAREFFEARKHIESPLDGYGHHRQIEFLCQQEGAALELAHLAGESARTFGKHHYRHAVGQQPLGAVHGAAQR